MTQPQPPVPRGHPEPIGEHGRSHGRVSSWILVFAVIAAFVAGGLAMILHVWWLFWVCLAVVVLSVPAGGFVGIMNDTVAWGHALPPKYQPPRHTAVEKAREERRRDTGKADAENSGDTPDGDTDQERDP
ncbi:MAG: hypothetical protein GEV11_14260 [Streptosporangiales bacterium]|nr:hypothetical protein [Streptosporangiales bacterium]